MTKVFERRSLQLTNEEWESLIRVAQKHNTAPRASGAYSQPSWRTLIKYIASGKLRVTGRAELNPKQNQQ